MSEPTGQAAAEILAADPGLTRLDPRHLQALRDWSSNYSFVVQNLLYRTTEAEEYGRVEREFAGRMITALDEVFRLVDGPREAITVFRGGRLPTSEAPIPGFISLTTDEAVATQVAGPRGDVWELELPARSPAVFLPAVIEPVTATENEVLLVRGSRLILEEMQERPTGGRRGRVVLIS